MTAPLLAGKRGAIFGIANDKSIAWACAQACAAAGADLCFNFLGEAQEKRVRKLIGTLERNPDCFPCDVTNDEEVTAFFSWVKEKWGGLDFLIHSVAYADRGDLMGRFVDTNRKNFAMAIDISAYSLVSLSREAAPLMTTGGAVVAMSYYGAEKVIPKYNVMGVAKATLEACSRYLASDLGPQQIRVNCISAGPLRTLSSSAISGMRDMLKINEQVAPLRRNITGEDVANAALYLLSDLGSGVTGEVLHVDAGYNTLGMFTAIE